MRKNSIYGIFGLMSAACLFAVSCMDDLDRFPQNDYTDEQVYETYDGTVGAAAKVYGSFVLTGNTGPAGSPDIIGLDEGSYADFLRGLFNLQELPTDEALCAWNDTGISGLNFISFTDDNPFIRGFYYRCMINVVYTNEFIKNTTEGKLSERSFSEAEKTDIRHYRAEARFWRAFAYWVMMDTFGNPPFIDENFGAGMLPVQIQRADLYGYIESELLDLLNANLLQAARSAEYGRPDQAAACALLARIYLNAEIYIGQAKYTEAITYSRRAIDAGYSLTADYEHLFLADNNLNNNEVILSLNYDGQHTWNYGGTTFIINSSFSSANLRGQTYGLTANAGWGGNRSTSGLVSLFDPYDDGRYLFVGETAVISDASTFAQGYAPYKFRNITAGGSTGASGNTYADVDFPLFRLAEMYLIYNEAMKRGGTGGSESDALQYMNNLRARAWGNTSANWQAYGSYSLQDILDERGRELYWECHRRTDLIRYGLLTTSTYLWPWKGGSANGRSVGNHFNLYPLPASDLLANSNLRQNPGY